MLLFILNLFCRGYLFCRIYLFCRSSLQYALAPGKSTLAELFIPKSTKLDEYEVCPDAGVIVEHMSNTLAAYGGSSLIVDYGNDSCGGHSLRVCT